jgi:Flp pilus assembly protein TadG
MPILRHGGRRRRARNAPEAGQVLIEFVVGSTVLMMTIFGILSFGLAIWQYNMMSDLAQEGARWASVHGSASNAPASTTDVQNYVTSRALGMTVTVTTTPAPSTISAGSTVTVRVRRTSSTFTSYVPQASILLSSTAKMVMAR